MCGDGKSAVCFDDFKPYLVGCFRKQGITTGCIAIRKTNTISKQWIFRSTGSKMRPSFLATCIIGLFGQKDRRTKSSKPALVSSFLESSLEFSFAGIECFRRLEADISPFLRMEAKLDKSVKW